MIQEIFFDLFGYFIFKDVFYLCENGNYDVCVSDVEVCCVVVFKSFGILRYKYSGCFQFSFEFGSLVCDSLCYILIVDKVQNCVYIIDKDG